MIDEKIEYYLWLSIEKVLKDGLPTVQIQFPGTAQKKTEGVEEWINFWPITLNEESRRRGVFVGPGTFQVSCFSQFAEDREDRRMEAPWDLAGRVNEVLGSADVEIRSHGQVPLSLLGVLSIRRPTNQYIDESRLFGVAVKGSEAGTVHSVVSTYDFYFSSTGTE